MDEYTLQRGARWLTTPSRNASSIRHASMNGAPVPTHMTRLLSAVPSRSLCHVALCSFAPHRRMHLRANLYVPVATSTARATRARERLQDAESQRPQRDPGFDRSARLGVSAPTGDRTTVSNRWRWRGRQGRERRRNDAQPVEPRIQPARRTYLMNSRHQLLPLCVPTPTNLAVPRAWLVDGLGNHEALGVDSKAEVVADVQQAG